ncbi:transcription factor 21 [Oncorhynchus mykiss]|uniref:Transcription factor 21 n=1 Tax=Oncorhynchus mykiss TaxID=8022 RepID=A0A8C7LQA3_ONCMY|nr:transcription factor 21 [Oncorhynchus mykiss]
MSSLLGLEEEEEEDTQRGARSPQSPAVLVRPVPHSAEATRPNRQPNMSTGSLSDFDDEVLDGILKFGSSGKDSGTSNESTEESSNCEGGSANDKAAAGKKRKTAYSRKKEPNSVAHEGCGKPVQRNAANARERARMRVLSKAFSRLKMTLPWVPPDTKLSKLDTLRLASSYIAHLRQILANDKYENGYNHPVNLTWPFMVAGKPENDLKEMLNTTRLCGTTAS